MYFNHVFIVGEDEMFYVLVCIGLDIGRRPQNQNRTERYFPTVLVPWEMRAKMRGLVTIKG